MWKKRRNGWSGRGILAGCPAWAGMLLATNVFAGGVTLITHGFNSSATGWVTGTANAIPPYRSFPGSNSSTYFVTLTTDGSRYYTNVVRNAGVAPATTDSGEIIIELDWSQMAGGGNAPYDISTYNVGQIAGDFLMATNAIAELNGHALAELPLHLIGHSRGGSLVSEISRILGTNGVWVDHLTTLDPHPLDNDGFGYSFFPKDASAANTYANVLFQDNYWQHLSVLTDTDGESVTGAYNRQLSSLAGGYGSDHSNVHLWYFGTMSLVTPTGDTEATISGTERAAWWNAYEQQGSNAGFEYSLVGGVSRLSTDRPLGPGFPAIRDGFNQYWDLGAGTSVNRVALATNNASWASLIRFNRADTNVAILGQSVTVNFYYQWAVPAASNATLAFYLDNDRNILNTNQTLLKQLAAPGTGSNSVALGSTLLPIASSNATPGWHTLLASLTAGGHTRYLFAPEPIFVLPPTSPSLAINRLASNRVTVTITATSGQTVVLQSSPDFSNWQSILTNTFSTNTWTFTNSVLTNRQFLRALTPY